MLEERDSKYEKEMAESSEMASNYSLHLHPHHPPSTIDTIHTEAKFSCPFIFLLCPFSLLLLLLFLFSSDLVTFMGYTGRLKCRSRSRLRAIQSVNDPRLGSIEPDRGSHVVPSIPATLIQLL